jgi:hypothetical protein
MTDHMQQGIALLDQFLALVDADRQQARRRQADRIAAAAQLAAAPQIVSSNHP